jgi:hypothetical protein
MSQLTPNTIPCLSRGLFQRAAKAEYYVLIYDSSTDSRVLSDVIDRYDGLISQNFRQIVAIRDVAPQANTEIPAIRSDFVALTPSSPVKPTLTLAVREIEAWFIAEYKHFIRRHPALTPPAVAAALGCDPATCDVQLISEPALSLRAAYNLAGIGYNKSRAHVEQTVALLDYAHLYFNLRTRIPDLDTLIACIDRFLS